MKNVKCCKYVDILIDNDLKWQERIDYVLHAVGPMHCCFMFYHLTFIVLCCSVLGLAIHCSYCIKRFSLPTARMLNKLLDLTMYIIN